MGLGGAFWLAFVRWLDGFEPWHKDWGRKALPWLWRGLVGYASGPRQRQEMHEFADTIGTLRTAQTMCSAVESAGHVPTGVVFKQFAHACRNLISREFGSVPPPPLPSMNQAEARLDSADGAVPETVSTLQPGPRPPHRVDAADADDTGGGAAVLLQTAALVPGSLADTVAQALTKPFRSCFEGWML